MGSIRSPERTRPRLLPGSPALHAAGDSPASGGAAPPAPPSSGPPRAASRPDRRSDAPSCGSPVLTAQTLATAPQGCDRRASARSSVAGTQDCRGDGFWASGTPIIPKDKVSTKPGQLQRTPPSAKQEGTWSPGSRVGSQAPGGGRE